MKCLNAISTGKTPTNITVRILKLPGTHKLKVKLDTGANANALPMRTFWQMYGDMEPSRILNSTSKAKLTAYSGDTIKCLGSISIDCQHNSKWIPMTFYVVDVPGPRTSQLRRTETSVDYLPAGRYGPSAQIYLIHHRPEACRYTLRCSIPSVTSRNQQILLKPDAVPHIDRPRKCNINLLPKIKAEITKMENMAVIRRVKEHTDWCSSLMYSTKRDGSIRVCLDPRHLNDAVKRCPHKIPTLEEI